ncbi:MAG: preprotein translocase subunit SecG [Bacteroidales bacterium]
MYITISILIVIASILMTIVVLVQNSKGGGLAANFAAGNQTFGVRQTADFLEKATWTLAIIMCVLSILATAFISTNNSTNPASELTNQIEQSSTQQGLPNFPILPQEETIPAENTPIK